ncbi:transposase domain-containing protein, partial [Paracoccus sp. 22332]|uniref:transposase domain-containing protein n=1 Tax=Paracoccus sp. 22332 TaxID=3453913 RepID=UPI003F866A0D
MDDFYAARSSSMPPLPWTSFSPPFSLEAAGLGGATGPGRLIYPFVIASFCSVRQEDMVSIAMSGTTTPLPNDPAALKAIIAALQAENQKMSASLRAHDLLVQALRVRIAKLQKQKFGASSEKIEREIEQLELALEDLQLAL